MTPYEELFATDDLAIVDAAMKCSQVFGDHSRAVVSISGGADSDVMLDLCERVRTESPIEIYYAFFDTGIEYRATRRHLDYLEGRYGIRVERRRAIRTIPVCCREDGQPFVSKMVSHHIKELQRGGFDWSDDPLGELAERFPDVNYSSLKWWKNGYTAKDGSYSIYSIGRNKWLKEFLMSTPPWFPISESCCTYAKKLVGRAFMEEAGADLNVVGVRRAEGGARATIRSCFTQGHGGHDTYRPLFWLTDGSRARYEEMFGIRHSDCYEVWGYKRTGCVGCPFNGSCEEELGMAEAYEPNLVRAARRVFADAYEYTRMYREFSARMDEELHGTDEWKARIEGKIAKIRKAVTQMDKAGNVVATYRSQAEASEATGVDQSAISRCANGERKTAGGYRWSFVE